MSADRAAAMAARLDTTAERLGLDDEGRARIAAAFELAMAPRRAAALVERDPAYLHPARSALILMDDAGVADARTLAAALVTETRDEALRPASADVEHLGAEVAALAAAVPRGSGADLLERLVTAPPEALLIALAERLDHARHLHLREASQWAEYHATTCRAYAPAASRAHPVLERRFAWWCRTFERRFLQRG